MVCTDCNIAYYDGRRDALRDELTYLEKVSKEASELALSEGNVFDVLLLFDNFILKLRNRIKELESK